MYPLVIWYVAMENRLFMRIRDSTVLNYQLVNDSFKLDCAIFVYHFQTRCSDPIIPNRIFQPWDGKVSSIREISLLLELNHPNVVQCREVVPRSVERKRGQNGWVLLVKIMATLRKTMVLF